MCCNAIRIKPTYICTGDQVSFDSAQAYMYRCDLLLTDLRFVLLFASATAEVEKPAARSNNDRTETPRLWEMHHVPISTFSPSQSNFLIIKRNGAMIGPVNLASVWPYCVR